MLLFYAQPVVPTVTGFYFCTPDAYAAGLQRVRNGSAPPQKKFRLFLIGSDPLDRDLAIVFGLSHANVVRFMDVAARWSADDKLRVIVARAFCKQQFDPATVEPDDLNVTVYRACNTYEVAKQLVEAGHFGDIPAPIRNFIDYTKISLKLDRDHNRSVIGNIEIIWRCGRT